jgi:hypothetical protein
MQARVWFTNVIADGLSRCVQETSESQLQSGFMQRQMPTFPWKERWWTGCGENAIWQEWRRTLSDPTLQHSSHLSTTSSPCSGWIPTWENR